MQAALEQAVELGLVTDCAIASSLSDAEDFWRLRQSIPELLSHLKPTVNFDVGLPWSETTAYIKRVGLRMRQEFSEAEHLFFGHLGDNNIHLMTGPHPADRHDAVERIVYGELGARGTVSAEHGIGFLKKPLLHTTRNEGQLQLLRKLKRALDPENLLNPSRVFDD